MTNPETLPAFICLARANAGRLQLIATPASGPLESPPPGESNEAALLAAVALRGDESAFNELYHAHIESVLSAARRICGSGGVAEDIAQRTFMTLWERAARLAARPVRLRPWLLTVTRNAAIDYVRVQTTKIPMLAVAAVDAVDCPQTIAVANALATGLAPALATLPRDQRAVIELRYFQNLTFMEIAKRTGEPLGTVKSRARLAIEHLRRSIGG